jgi:hypothetical protein
MTPRELRIYNALPWFLRPAALIVGDVWSILTLGRRWGR